MKGLIIVTGWSGVCWANLIIKRGCNSGFGEMKIQILLTLKTPMTKMNPVVTVVALKWEIF